MWCLKTPLEMDQSLCISNLGLLGIGICMLYLVWWHAGGRLAWLLLDMRGRRASTAKTPPRTLSPVDKGNNNGDATPPTGTDHENSFPPSIRESLVATISKLPITEQHRLSTKQFDEAEFRKGILPFEADYRESGPSNFTPTGVSLGEVTALGEFPDYSQLSGVPLPQAYKEFKLETALPRPYRPFRWAYHQTMCEYLFAYSAT